MAAQFRTDVFRRRGGKKATASKPSSPGSARPLPEPPPPAAATRSVLVSATVSVGFPVSCRIAVFAGLRHHPVIAGHHQQRMVNTAHPASMLDKTFRARERQ